MKFNCFTECMATKKHSLLSLLLLLLGLLLRLKMVQSAILRARLLYHVLWYSFSILSSTPQLSHSISLSISSRFFSNSHHHTYCHHCRSTHFLLHCVALVVYCCCSQVTKNPIQSLLTWSCVCITLLLMKR